MNKGKIIGLVGSLLLILGPFCPLIHVPFLGDLSYMSNGGHSDGIFIIIIGILAIILSFVESKINVFLGIIPIIILLYFFTNLQHIINNNNFLLNAISISWGFGIIIIGSICTIISGFLMKTNKKIKSKKPENIKENHAIKICKKCGFDMKNRNICENCNTFNG